MQRGHVNPVRAASGEKNNCALHSGHGIVNIETTFPDSVERRDAPRHSWELWEE